MGKSKVTDYMIRYIEENRMDAKSLAAHAGIDAGNCGRIIRNRWMRRNFFHSAHILVSDRNRYSGCCEPLFASDIITCNA